MKLTAISLFIFSVVLLSCNNDPAPVQEESFSQIAKCSWLLGDWQDTVNTNQWEVWRRNGDSLYGFAGFIKGNDTSFFERLSIKEIDGKLVYTALIMKNKKAVSFAANRVNDSYAVFQNPSHDFPKFISYELKNSLKGNTYLRSTVYDNDKRLDFDMIKRR